LVSNAVGKVAVATTTSTELGYVNGVTSAIQTQLDAKQATLVSGTNIKTVNSTSLLGSGDVAVQPTLVSGTNIKTINSNSLLGSGDIAISANPSGVSGAIQFSDGSAFASDATNLFWDDTNNRLGVGTNSPSARVNFKGTGSTSATTSLLVQNSVGTAAMTVKDDLTATFNGDTFTNGIITISSSINQRIVFGSSDLGTFAVAGTASAFSNFSQSGDMIFRSNTTGKNVIITARNAGGQIKFGTGSPDTEKMTLTSTGALSINNPTPNASAILQADSTTQGFLPPRMTNLQRTSISSPAVGLMVYCTDAVEGLYINKSTGWTLVI
jgi:hypothetical protein